MKLFVGSSERPQKILLRRVLRELQRLTDCRAPTVENRLSSPPKRSHQVPGTGYPDINRRPAIWDAAKGSRGHHERFVVTRGFLNEVGPLAARRSVHGEPLDGGTLRW